jgi:hypothetical protein
MEEVKELEATEEETKKINLPHTIKLWEVKKYQRLFLNIRCALE